MRAVARDTEVARHHARHASVVDQKVRRREARQHADAERLGLRGEPDAKIAEAHDPVAVVAQEPRHEQSGHREPGVRATQPIETLGRDRRTERRAARDVVGEELRERANLEHRA